MTACTDGPRTIGELAAVGEARLERAGVPAARLEAEILLGHCLALSRAGLLSRWRDVVPGETAARFEALIERREARYPIQYLTGRQEFFSLEFEVDERVLIPRPETEMVVEEVLRLSRAAGAAKAAEAAAGVSSDPAEAGRDAAPASACLCGAEALKQGTPRDPSSGATEAAEARRPLVADVGTGSGCIAIAIAVHLPTARVLASDVSGPALEVAARNARRHAVDDRIELVQGDGLEPARRAGLAGSVDFVVSNPPYVPERELDGLQRELRHEPRIALTPGPDGLAFTSRLVDEASRILRSGGWLLVELGAGSAGAAASLPVSELWCDVSVKPDIQGIPRLLCARRRPD
jgi:release factor glutamine methyltransferase